MFKVLFTAAASALLLCGTAHAGLVNLVNNGGFETGNFSGWTEIDSGGGQGVSSYAGGSHSCTYGAYFGRSGSTGGIFQTLNTVAGETYNVSFWLRNPALGSTTSFDFNWDGGASELAQLNIAQPDYTQFSFTLVASTASTDLRFSARNDPSAYRLDDVVVTLANPVVTADVPEPMSLALVGVALVGAFGATRRKAA